MTRFPFTDLRWHVLDLRLRNSRNAFAREHPLSVFDAILKFAAGLPGRECRFPFFFQPRQPVDRIIRRGLGYPLRLVFPDAGPEQAARLGANVARWLADPARNFELLEQGEPRPRNLAALLAELAPPPAGADEICLDFLTPLPVPRSLQGRRWRLEAADLFVLLSARLRRLFGPAAETDLTRLAPAWAGLRLLPWFWEYEEYRHRARSSPGERYINGQAGPLYLRGAIEPVLPLLLLCSELNLGRRLSAGQGCYRLCWDRPCLDDRLTRPDFLRARLAEVRDADDRLAGATLAAEHGLDRWLPERAAVSADPAKAWSEERHALGQGGPSAGAVALVEAARFGPEAASLLAGPTGASGPGASTGAAESGRDGELAPAELLRHGLLARLLDPVLERVRETVDPDRREGRTLAASRRRLAARVRQGFPLAARLDLELLFAELTPARLALCLADLLPRSDRRTLALTVEAGRAALAEAGDMRRRGLPPGSPLAGALTGLALADAFRRLAAQGRTLMAHGHDLFIPLRDSGEAAAVEATIRADLTGADTPESIKAEPPQPTGTALPPPARPESSAPTGSEPPAPTGDEPPASAEDDWPAPTAEDAPPDALAGFAVLDLAAGEPLAEETAEAVLRRPLFVTDRYAAVGLEGDSLTIRRDGALVGRAPLRRVGEVNLCGVGSVSHRLVQRCLEEGVSVNFHGASGWRLGSVRPESKEWFAALHGHAARHAALTAGENAALAAAVVAAKITGYLRWLPPLLGSAGASLADSGAEALAVLARTPGPAQAMGMEGGFARRSFPAVNSLAPEGFRSARRLPRVKPDAWNALLDALYSLLHARLDSLTRGQGLNPYLGWLHSPRSRYASLIADLQEPFRARMDRLAVRLTQTGTLVPEDFAQRDGRPHLAGKAYARLLEAFETEQDTRLAGDPADLRHLLDEQARAVRRWVEGGPLRLYNLRDWSPLEARS